MEMVYKIDWEESERGWGSRPDGTSLHKSKEEVDSFINHHWERYSNIYGDTVPDEYSRPLEVKIITVPKDLHDFVHEQGSVWITCTKHWKASDEYNLKELKEWADGKTN